MNTEIEILPLPRVSGMQPDDLCEMLWSEKRLFARQRIIEKLLCNLEPQQMMKNKLYSRSTAIIESCDGQIKVNELANLLGVSTRTLERKYFEILGVSPKQFIRLVRFQKTVEKLKRLHQFKTYTDKESFALKSYLEIAMNYPQLSGMCTSFALTGPATKNGITMIGQNIDWHPDAPIDLLHIKHRDGLEQLAICFLGNCTYYLNSAGIGNCSNLTISPMGPITMHIPLDVQTVSGS